MGCKWSRGVYLVLGGVPGPGGLPGPVGCTWPKGVYLVLGAVPGPPGGVPSLGGVPGPAGVPGQVLLPL